MKKNTYWTILLALGCFQASAFAQSAASTQQVSGDQTAGLTQPAASTQPAGIIQTTGPTQPPAVPAHKPIFNAAVGYSYLSLPVPSAARVALNGVSASFTAEFRSRFGAKADVSYSRAGNVLGSGHQSDILTYMLGPIYFPVSNDRTRVYVQALAGNAQVNSIVPNGSGGFDAGYTSGLSWVFGGGIERNIAPSLAIRTEGDYMRTPFLDATALFISQSDLRITGSVVYRWGGLAQGGRTRRRFKLF